MAGAPRSLGTAKFHGSPVVNFPERRVLEEGIMSEWTPDLTGSGPAPRPVSRRVFLRFGLIAAASVPLAVACGQQPPAAPAPTAAPAKPAEAPKPAEAKPAAPAPTAAPAPKPAEAAKPTEVAKPAAKAQENLGAQLIGKIEGPEIITDQAKWPKQFKQAPMLAELVTAGRLPPVEQRVPQEPLVLQPLHEIGKYGGTWRRGFTGPADVENMGRIMSLDRLIFVDYTGTKIVPSLAKEWTIGDGGRTIRLTLRKGLKWSDGHPMTTDDIMFWFEDLYSNKDIYPGATPEMAINGKPGAFVKIDEVTVEARFPEPYPMFVDVLAGFTLVGGGHVLGGTQWGGFMGGFAPAHYLKQFHPKYANKDELDQKARAANLDGWLAQLKLKNNPHLNPECPVMTPWRTVTPINTPSWTLERNPFFWCVDTEGNQLPYIDKVSLTLAENLEVANLRAIAGEYDLQTRHLDVAKLPVFLENRQKGNYRVVLDRGYDAADTAIHINQTYDADPEIAKWLTNRDFRRALSMGIDRDQLNETFFLGMGIPGSLAPRDDAPDSPGPEWRTKWSTLDINQANELLDKIGLNQKDSEGYRLRTDGKGRLRIELGTVGAAFLPWTQQMEMVAQHWKKIGIQADVKEQERSLADTNARSNLHQTRIWGGGSPEIFLWPRHDFPSEVNEPFSGTHYATWYATNGAQGKKPEDPDLLRVYDLMREGAGVETEPRNKLAAEIKKLVVDNLWVLGTVGFRPMVRVISNRLSNVPERLAWYPRNRTPGSTHPSTYFFKS
jgi:peptide/nickel transport system substrate-binding protein